MTARLALVLLVVSMALVGPAGSALACSCDLSGAAALLDDVEVAVVGTVDAVTRDVAADRGEYGVDVEQVGGGMVPAHLRVVTPSLTSDACGVEAAVGDRVGWGLRRVGGRLSVDLCSTVPADELAALPGVRPIVGDAPDVLPEPVALDESPLFPVGVALTAIAALLGAVLWLERR